MNSNYSFLQTLLTRVRAYVDEPDVDAKYTDDFILRHFIMPSLTEAYARINLSASDPALCKYSFTLGGTGNRYYQLPANVGEIRRLVVRQSDGSILYDFRPRSDRHRLEAGWSIEGNVLYTPVETGATYSCSLEYLPTGDYFPHLGASAGLTESSTGVGYNTVQLAASPTLGQVDRRVNGLAGGYIRLIPSSGKVQERLIESSFLSGGNWFVKTILPFDTGTNPYTDTYEIAPMGSQSFNEMVSLSAAIRLAVARKQPPSVIRNFQLLYASARKTAVDAAAYRQNRTGHAFGKDSVDNDLFTIFG